MNGPLMAAQCLSRDRVSQGRGGGRSLLSGPRAMSVAAEEEARPQREAGVCVKVPGFCVVRTHSQVLSSNDMM